MYVTRRMVYYLLTIWKYEGFVKSYYICHSHWFSHIFSPIWAPAGPVTDRPTPGAIAFPANAPIPPTMIFSSMQSRWELEEVDCCGEYSWL